MNSLYYNSYTTPKEKYDDKDKQNLKYNPNKINIIKIKNSSNQNNNNNNLLVQDITNGKKIEKNYNLYLNNINNERKNVFGDISKKNKDVITFSTEDNSHLEINENKEINRKTNYGHNFIKRKMIYKKPDLKLNVKEKEKYDRIINLTKINNDDDERIKTTRNDSNIKKEIKLGNALTPIKNFKQISKWNFKNKIADVPNMNYIKKNYNSNTNNINNTNCISKDKKYLSKFSINKRETEIFITKFFDDIIELSDAIKEKSIFEILIKKINQKYFIDYKQIFFETNIIDVKGNFNYCFKYFCIILISFYFLSKEESLYKNNFEKINLLFIQYISS